MRLPSFIDLKQARRELADMGITLSERQMKRAAEMDGDGKRKLPFFKDPIDGKLKIDRDTLRRVYLERHTQATRNIRSEFNSNC